MARFSSFLRANDGTAWWVEGEGTRPLRRTGVARDARALHARLHRRRPHPAQPLQQLQADRADRRPRDDPDRDGARRAHRAHELEAPADPRCASGWATRSATGRATRWWSTPPTSIPSRRCAAARRTCTSSSDSPCSPTATCCYRFTVEDTTVWTAPWTGEYIWRATDDRVYEYACHEGNYAMGNVLRGARLLEKEALEGKK